jgi:MSHA biogenesis protein MshI
MPLRRKHLAVRNALEPALLAFMKKAAVSDRLVGLAITRERLALAVVHRHGGSAPVLERCVSIPGSNPGTPQAVAEALRSSDVPAAPIRVVLETGDYQIVLLEAPDVPPAELRAAMRWRLREQIDFPVEDAVIDVFDVPPQSRAANGRMVYAVAAKRDLIESRSAIFAGRAGAHVIDIPELALRNLAMLLPTSAAGVALLHLRDDTATVVLVRGGTFYFSRQMRLQSLLEPGEGGGSTIDPSSVALELQRSLDYYERHFDQPPITNVCIAPAGPRSQTLVEGLIRETGLAVTELDLNRRLSCSTTLEPDVQRDCLLAVGAALRVERRSL